MEYYELELNKQTSLTNIVLLHFANNTYMLFMHLITCHAKYGLWKWNLWNVHVALASWTTGCLFPCRDVHFNYGGIGLLDGRWQYCITTVNISTYTWVYKCHMHECIWKNKRVWYEWADVLNFIWRYINELIKKNLVCCAFPICVLQNDPPMIPRDTYIYLHIKLLLGELIGIGPLTLQRAIFLT